MGFFTAAIFAANIAFVVVASCQLRALYQSNEHASRAWLTIKHVQDAPPIIPGSHAPLTAVIENTGRSPAQNVRIDSTTAFAPSDWRIPDRSPKPSENNIGVIGPTQTLSVDFMKKEPLTPADVEAINKGAMKLYWFADVTYEDQFSRDRALQFCFRYEPPKPNKTSVSFPTCDTHASVK